MDDPLYHRKDWTIDDWKSYWDGGKVLFQTNEYQNGLLRHENLLFPLAGTRCRVLVPLCGKSYDMKWFADKGHEVVGVDCSETAVEGFYSEHGLQYTITDDGPFKVLKSGTSDCDISCYVGDIFDLPMARFAKCNVVWDYGSIVAIKPQERSKYMEAILGKLATEANYLLAVFNFDGYDFPPAAAYHISSDTVHEVFSRAFHIAAMPESSRERMLAGRPIAMENYYHLVKKV